MFGMGGRKSDICYQGVRSIEEMGLHLRNSMDIWLPQVTAEPTEPQQLLLVLVTFPLIMPNKGAVVGRLEDFR